jgi:hypothetical protein
MEEDFEPGEHDFGCLLEPFEIVPPAMTGELALEGAPQTPYQVELRRVGR